MFPYVQYMMERREWNLKLDVMGLTQVSSTFSNCDVQRQHEHSRRVLDGAFSLRGIALRHFGRTDSTHAVTVPGKSADKFCT